MAIDTPPKVAFLGPIGTYSHEVAQNKFGSDAEYVALNTITEVFKALSKPVKAQYAVIPQENSIFGSVVESYDSLRLPAAGSDIFVRGEYTLAIQHCLVVKKGVKLESVKRIVSHEQALGQCSRYLSEHFPNACREKMPSTAAAAQSLLDETSTSEDGGESAAICSSVCIQTFAGLELVQKGIQNESANFTRFYVLSSSLDSAPPATFGGPQLRRGLVRLSLPPTMGFAHGAGQPSLTHKRPLHMVISTLLTTFGMPITRIDRRPSLSPIPFEDLYFVELEELGSYTEPDISDKALALEDKRWLEKLKTGIERAAALGAQATLLGFWYS